MKSILNKQIIDKYILAEFGEIPNPLTEKEMKGLIYNNNLTLEKVKLWALFDGDLMIKGISGNIILHSASYKGQLDIIQYILNKEVDVDYLNDYNEIPLLFASINGHIEVINLLLERGTNINHQGKNGWSALHYACCWNHSEVVKLLIEKGININLKNNDNETALNTTKNKKIIDYLTPFYNNN